MPITKMNALFACTKCNSRHLFEELSPGQQLCKECRGAFPVVKCTYCRTEFQQINKGSTSTICKKCEQNVKSFGKPSACEYCNIIAAFIGTKCQRCTNSEKKHGSPLTCEQCRQRCAFDRKDDDRKKVDGKLLCWLCTLSYKRALAKAKHDGRSSSSLPSLHKPHHRSSSHKSKSNHRHGSSDASSGGGSSNKKPRIDNNKSTNGSLPSFGESMFSDPNSSDHVVAVTQMREQIASLQKQLSQKDNVLLSKEKHITELKAQHSAVERDMIKKGQASTKQHQDQVGELNLKNRQLLKQVATLTKANKRGGTNSDKNDSPLTL
ncbi:Protein FAM76A [Nymphon striatum]|nr:Protein FAM76A [Nymphon striatum]